MLVYCWNIVYDAGLTLNQHWVNVPRLPRWHHKPWLWHDLWNNITTELAPIREIKYQEMRPEQGAIKVSVPYFIDCGRVQIWCPYQQRRDVHPMLAQCWFIVCDACLTLYQHWVNVWCLLGWQCVVYHVITGCDNGHDDWCPARRERGTRTQGTFNNHDNLAGEFRDFSAVQALDVFQNLSLRALKYFYRYKPWKPKGFFQFKIIINVLVSSFRFIWIRYLSYGSMAIIIFWFFQSWDRLYTSESDVYRRQMVRRSLCWKG